MSRPDARLFDRPVDVGARQSTGCEHMILPALTLGLVLYGDYTLIVRSAMLETLGEDYVLTARAKGLNELVDRPAARACATRCCRSSRSSRSRSASSSAARSPSSTSSPTRASGSLIVEAIDQRDYPMLQARLPAAHAVGDLLQPARRPPLLQVRPAGDRVSPDRARLQSADEDGLAHGIAAAEPALASCARSCSATAPAMVAARRPRLLRLPRDLRAAADRAVRPDRRRSAPVFAPPSSEFRLGTDDGGATWSRC